MALIFRGSSLKKLVSVYASSHDSHVDMKTRPSTRSTEKQGAYRLREGRGEESARAVCASRKNDFTRGAEGVAGGGGACAWERVLERSRTLD